VVLHHSFGSPGWTAFPDHLAADHRVLLPELPGFGDSGMPEWARHPRDLAVLLGLWFDRLGLGPVTVTGCGFGGWIAAELATMSPARLSGLVLVGAAGLLPERGRILDQMLTSHSVYVRSAFLAGGAYEEHYGVELDDEVLMRWALAREMTTRVSWKPYMYNRRLDPLLPELTVPTLVVWGSDDAVVPRECGERYARLIPDARLEVVDRSGHAVDLERPEALAELVRGFVAALPVSVDDESSG
jgi:pimeloyl-ACP methyl ester carboxylesterase